MVLNEKQIQTNLNQVPGWEYKDGYLTKTYKLSDFKASLTFVNKVGELAEEAGHHPDIVIQYNKVNLSLRTHDEDGITSKDFDLSEKIEKL